MLILDDHLVNETVLIGQNIINSNDHRLIVENGVYRIEPNPNLKITIGSKFTELQQEKFNNTITEYAGNFGESLDKIGKYKYMKTSIKLLDENPVVRKPYKIPFAKREGVEKMINELLLNNIIRPSSSRYASPIILIKKQNGEDRMCIDFRELNAKTEKIPTFMPSVEEILSRLSGKRFFTTLDLLSGYYQLEMEESSRQYTAFITHNGHFEFNRLLFGLVNAPRFFQQMICSVIQTMKDNVISYVDEVIISSETIEEGLEYLEKVLMMFRKAGLILRPSKCVFLSEEIDFLGHKLSKDGIMPGFKKMDAVNNFPIPTDATEVRRFLGLCGFFRKFVKDFSMIAKPLINLTKTKNQPTFNWTTECESAFSKLKTILCNKPVLDIYDPRRNHEVHAPSVLQQQNNLTWKPVFYFSRLCSETEQQYHSHELEVLAIVETLQRFRIYLIGKHFTIVTDCNSIQTTKNTSPMIPRIARWWLKLLEYD